MLVVIGFLLTCFTASAIVGYLAYHDGWRRGRREEHELWMQRWRTNTPPGVIPPPEPWPRPDDRKPGWR